MDASLGAHPTKLGEVEAVLAKTFTPELSLQIRNQYPLWRHGGAKSSASDVLSRIATDYMFKGSSRKVSLLLLAVVLASDLALLQRWRQKFRRRAFPFTPTSSTPAPAGSSAPGPPAQRTPLSILTRERRPPATPRFALERCATAQSSPLCLARSSPPGRMRILRCPEGSPTFGRGSSRTHR